MFPMLSPLEAGGMCRINRLVSKGKFAGAVLFVIQREDAAAFRPAATSIRILQKP